jgi:hypothetical protein
LQQFPIHWISTKQVLFACQAIYIWL